MNSRTWLAVVLCIGIWFVYIEWFAPPPPSMDPSTGKVATTQSSAESPQTTPTISAGGPQKSEVFGAFSGLTLLPKTLETKSLVSIFSAQGGKLADVRAKSHRESLKKDAAFVPILDPAKSHFNLATLFTDKRLEKLSWSDYSVTEMGANSAQFKASEGAIQIQKNYELMDASPWMNATITLRLPEAGDWGAVLIPVGSTEPKYDANTPIDSWEVVAYQNDKVTRKTMDGLDIEDQLMQGANSRWIAFGNRYFTTAVVNDSELNPDIVFVKKHGFSGVYFKFPLSSKEAGQLIELKFQYYLGGKDYTELAKVPGLKSLIDYGMFSVFAYPLLELLQFFYRFFHNYGLSIILLTIVVRLIFYPLSAKSYRSMKAMQKLQPQIAALKLKYKDDMTKMNQEQMALFKTHKVNPMGGCLPMLVQLPVFIALYAVLGNSIELYHAPFFGWIQDLSSKDPYYVYPVLMGLAMLVQTKLTPQTMADPMQQKMMYLMPVVFTFIMLNLPSGLTLYIFLSTLLGIIQQYSIQQSKDKTTPIIAAQVSKET